MATKMMVNLLPEQARQHLLKYFETRGDIKVRSSEFHSTQVRISGWRPPPWINIEIGMIKEENKTRLAFNFDFRMAYATFTIAILIFILFSWFIMTTHPESIGFVIGLTIATLVGYAVASAYEISKAKRKFLDDIRKAFDINKTD